MSRPAARLGDMYVCPMVTQGTPPCPHVGEPINGDDSGDGQVIFSTDTDLNLKSAARVYFAAKMSRLKGIANVEVTGGEVKLNGSGLTEVKGTPVKIN